MNNLGTVQSIADRVARGDMNLGRVYSKQDGDYVLLNYTREAMYGGDMTDTEKACRGLVVRTDGKIMALPMPKFFNLGEPQCPSLPDEAYTVREKIDGSLGIFWYDGEKWRCNTRGSLDNEYIDFATWWWTSMVDYVALSPSWTIMTEICFEGDPEPRAVHHDEGLYLVAARDNYSGKDFDTGDIGWLGLGFSHPGLVRAKGLEELQGEQKSAEGTEGWVIRYDSGLRVKIKTSWYLRMFRAIVNLTPKNIRRMMIGAGESWLDEFPDDLRPEAAAIQAEIETGFRELLASIYSAYSKVASIKSRKDYALTVLKDYPYIAHWLFNLRDDKFDELRVLESLDLDQFGNAWYHGGSSLTGQSARL